MNPVIRISDSTYARLQALARPFVDTPPASVIERLLNEHGANGETNGEKEVQTGARLDKGERVQEQIFHLETV